MRRGGSILVLAFLMLAAGCISPMSVPPSPLSSGYNPIDLSEPIGEASTDHNWEMADYFTVSEKLRLAMAPKKGMEQPKKRSILVLSGGGAYGAYSAGVLVGWTASGKRPNEFHVVTGISTGALIAPLAFLGSQYDEQLKTVYTTLQTSDVFRIRTSIQTILGEAVADNSPLAMKIDEMITPQLLKEIATEHEKGRRLYVGTTDLESRRGVQWDMGEIAKRGDIALFRKLLLASAAIPGIFPPVKINVTVEGRQLTERHIDGGVTNAMFFRAPYLTEEELKNPQKASLYNSDLYMLVAGKLYADPEEVKPRALTIAGQSVSTLIYSQTRGDLLKLYLACMLTGMNYHIAAMPQAFEAPKSSTNFDPGEMMKMFEEGYKQSKEGTAWREKPPGLERGEGTKLRAGTDLMKMDPGMKQLKPQPAGLLPWLQEMMTRNEQRSRRSRDATVNAREPAIRRIESGEPVPVIVPIENRNR